MDDAGLSIAGCEVLFLAYPPPPESLRFMTNDPDPNPYAAPAPLDSIEPPPPPVGPKTPYVSWVLAVLINLPAPVMFGIASSRGVGRFGMPLGIVVVTVIGLNACRLFPDFMGKLSRGSILVALSQLYPVLHMFVGAGAISICRFGQGGDLDGIFQVGAATILTGIGLILPSIAAGYLFSTIGSLFRKR